MKPQRRSKWLWIAVVTIVFALFGPATLMATSYDDDDDLSQWETFQKCFRPGDEATPATYT